MGKGYRTLVFDPKTFSNDVKGNCLVLSLAGTFEDDGGRKGGMVKHIENYSPERHDKILKRVVLRARTDGLHVVVHGVKVLAGESPNNNTTTRILDHLRNNGVAFTHFLSGTQKKQLYAMAA